MTTDSAKGRFVLIFTLSKPWKNYHREQFIRAIAANIERMNGIVICLEPTILSFFNLYRYPERILGWLKGDYRFRKDGNNIYVTHAKTIEHILFSARLKLLSKINAKLLKRQIKKVLSKINISEAGYIWVLHRPELYFLPGNTGEVGNVYDCCDDHLLTSDMNLAKVSGNAVREKMLSEKCGLVITTSGKLYKRNKEYNQNTFLIENGHNFTAKESDVSAERILMNLKKPIAGYIGLVRDWIDFELLEYVLKNNPDISFAFVGEVSKDSISIINDLERKFQNLYLTGRVSYNSLPRLMKYFDVGIIPFENNEFMESVNPNKFYEMISCLVPVVSTDIGDLKEKYSDVARIAGSKEEFSIYVKEVSVLKKEELGDIKNKMREISEESTWLIKAEYFSGLLKSYILNK